MKSFKLIIITTLFFIHCNFTLAQGNTSSFYNNDEHVVEIKTLADAEKLIQEGYDIDPDELAHTIILIGTPDELQKLIQNGYDVNKTYLCNTPLNSAIKAMVYLAAQSMNAGENKFSPNAVLEKIKILIKSGADVNKIACEGAMSPLEWASTFHLQSIQAAVADNVAIMSLVEKGNGYCNIPGIISKPCKDITASELKSIKETIHQTYYQSRIKYSYLFLEILKLLLNNGANINLKDSSGQTALHRVALTPPQESLELMKYLIEQGADVNAQDIDGNTPLFIAHAINNDEAVNLLIQSGADTSIKNNLGMTYDFVKGKGMRKRSFYTEEGNVITIDDKID